MEKEKNKVAFASMIAAVFLTAFKLVVGLLTGSLGILSEALHSALDLVAAAITWISVRISDKPADKNHHYGHGKIENLSALIETVLLLVTCVWIIYEATNRLISGATEIEISIWSYIVVITSIIVDFTRSRKLKKVAKKYNSQALEADALHFSTDILSSTVVLIGLICANFGIYIADSIAALGVAIIVIVISFQLGKKAINVLLDQAPKELTQQISEYLKNASEIKYYHDLRIRSAGADTFVDVTIHVNPEYNLIEAHKVADNIELKIKEIILRGKVTVHAEPHFDEKKELSNETI